MGISSYISITQDIFGSFILLVVLLGLLTTEQRGTRMNRLFILIIVCNVFRMISDAVAWVVMGNTKPYSYHLNHIANFSFYLFQYLLLAAFIDYVVTYIATKAKISKVIVHMVYIVCAISILLLVISQFNHMFYIIDEQNVYYRQSGFWVSQILWLLCMIINVGIIIVYRKYFNQREFLFLSVYALLPILAFPAHFIFYGLPIANAVSTIVIIIIYVSIQSEQGKLLKEKEVELTNFRIDVMLSQIQPHFLYNSLTAISGLCSIDPDRAEEALNDFSHYLRKNLDSLGNSHLITFENELEHLEHYLKLETMRFGEMINVVYDLNVKDFMIPPLTVQPLAENAVRYGITKNPSGGTLTISTRETQDNIVIIVRDDGLGFADNIIPNNTRRHIGIENVRKRLKLQLDGTLSVESKIGEGTVCTITIPKLESH